MPVELCTCGGRQMARVRAVRGAAVESGRRRTICDARLTGEMTFLPGLAILARGLRKACRRRSGPRGEPSCTHGGGSLRAP
eukprot:1409702-Prymnesium_polylepis.1